MPVAIATPSRVLSSSTSARPESAHASRAATMANWALRSSRRALTRSITSVGSTAAGAAIFTGSSSTQSAVSSFAPDRPANTPSQVLATSPPTGVVAPSPVTTTRVFDMVTSSFVGIAGDGTEAVAHRTLRSGEPQHDRERSGSAVLGALDERHRVADGLQVLDLVVGDLDGELLLGGHHDLDHG